MCTLGAFPLVFRHRHCEVMYLNAINMQCILENSAMNLKKDRRTNIYVRRSNSG